MPEKKPANLRMVAERVGLAPCSVSAVLNDTPASKAIPQSTKDRVFQAASELNYRPNLWARSLRTKRTRMVAAVTRDFGRGDVARIVAGLQHRLHQRGYLLALSTPDLEEPSHLTAQFRQRGIEGVIAIERAVPQQMEIPVAMVDLGYIEASEPLSEQMHTWLTSLGESAAEVMIRQIEQDSAVKRTKVDAKLPPAYFDLSGAVLGANAEVRESA